MLQTTQVQLQFQLPLQRRLLLHCINRCQPKTLASPQLHETYINSNDVGLIVIVLFPIQSSKIYQHLSLWVFLFPNTLTASFLECLKKDVHHPFTSTEIFQLTQASSHKAHQFLLWSLTRISPSPQKESHNYINKGLAQTCIYPHRKQVIMDKLFPFP